MSHPPGPGPQNPQNPYAQQPYGYPQQQPQQPPQPQYGYPQAPQHPQGTGYPPPQQPYGYPQQQPPGAWPAPAYTYSYAGWGARVGAFLIDMLITGLVPLIIASIGYVQVVKAAVHNVQSCDQQLTAACQTAPQYPGSSGLFIGLGALLGIAGMLWLSYREGTTGATPGKNVLKIKLVRESTGLPIGFGMDFGRRLLHGIDGVPCYLGYLWPLWDAKKQTFTDKIMSTVVVKAP